MTDINKLHVQSPHNWWEDVLSQAYWPVVELALTVGKYQKNQFRGCALHTRSKTSEVDLVTAVDEASDHMVVSAIKALFPNDTILSEESGLLDNHSGRQWIVDPLDGTTNFASGLPVFAVSIALWQDAAPIFGVVYAPILDDLAVAEYEKGSFLNNVKCVISTKTELNQCILGTGFPYDRATARNCNALNASRLIPKVRGLRRMGAAAYDLTLVAAGHLDAFWELRLSKWDIAAGKLMITESGGQFNETVKNGLYTVVTGNRTLVNQIISLVDLEN